MYIKSNHGLASILDSAETASARGAAPRNYAVHALRAASIASTSAWE
jgi:hypothetical protein